MPATLKADLVLLEVKLSNLAALKNSMECGLAIG